MPVDYLTSLNVFISGAKRKGLQGHALKNVRKALKAYLDHNEDGGLFY